MNNDTPQKSDGEIHRFWFVMIDFEVSQSISSLIEASWNFLIIKIIRIIPRLSTNQTGMGNHMYRYYNFRQFCDENGIEYNYNVWY